MLLTQNIQTYRIRSKDIIIEIIMCLILKSFVINKKSYVLAGFCSFVQFFIFSFTLFSSSA